jgi:hypothetical protein
MGLHPLSRSLTRSAQVFDAHLLDLGLVGDRTRCGRRDAHKPQINAQRLQNCTPAAARRMPTPHRMSPPSGDASAAAGPGSRTAAMSGLIRATTWTPRKPAAHATGSDPAITASDPPSPAAVNGASAAKPTSSTANPTRSAMPAEYAQAPARRTRSSARQAPAAIGAHVWRRRGRSAGREAADRSG